MTSCFGNIQWRWSPTALISCCNSLFLNASCFACPPSFCCFCLSLSQSTSFESSLLFPLKSLRSSPFERASALARQWSFAGAPFLVFVSNSFCFARRWSFTSKRVGGGVRSRVLPKECRTFFPKTTVSWQTVDLIWARFKLLFFKTKCYQK